MKVSIITCSFNRESTILGAIKSVLSQDYPNIEYIIVDGASTDNTAKVILEAIAGHENHIKFVSKPDHGMYEAINKGIQLATGDIIGLVHSDDMLYDNKVISEVVKRFKESGADFVYGDGIYVNDAMDKVIRDWIGGSYARWKVRCGWLPLHPTCYIKRDIMMKCGLYDETYKIAADTNLLVDYLYNQNLKVSYLKRYIIRMRMGGLSTDSDKRCQMWNEDIRLYSNYGFHPVILTKMMKMAWKVPQFIRAKWH